MATVARVIVDVSLPHLDRPFDYAIPEGMAPEVVVGSRVRVRFSGRLVDAYVAELADSSEHRLQPIQRVVSEYPVLVPDVLRLCREVADRYAGSLADVLRSAVPPRHARAEAAILRGDPPHVEIPSALPVQAWDDYVGGASLARRLSDGDRGLRAVLTCAPAGAVEPAGDWPMLLADLAAVTASRGGVIIVVPDARDLARVDAALVARLGRGAHAVLSADLGPQRRYSEFMRVLTHRVRIVLGTRAAAFAPVDDPALLMLWDDGDESLAEPHAPGWHAREVLALRSHLSGASFVTAGFTRSVESQLWVDTRWAAGIAPRREVLRRAAPRVIPDAPADGPARIPRHAYEAARAALGDGPVLVQVARRGYVPTLACQRCRSLAACAACGGPLALGARTGQPECRWCGTQVAHWRCRTCEGDRLRAVSVGSGRTAEELGRAFPGVAVVTSTGERAVASVTGDPALVIATPGTEPWAEGGYAAVLILDASGQLARVALRAGEETARRWFGAAALARPGAPVVVTADPAHPLMQALIRWDPAWLAARELEERRELGLPPVVRAATITGDPASVDSAMAILPPAVRAVGPLPTADPEQARLLVTVDRQHGADLTRALHDYSAGRSARKEPGRSHVAVDPPDWGAD